LVRFGQFVHRSGPKIGCQIKPGVGIGETDLLRERAHRERIASSGTTACGPMAGALNEAGKTLCLARTKSAIRTGELQNRKVNCQRSTLCSRRLRWLAEGSSKLELELMPSVEIALAERHSWRNAR
jgi:hypothetical protein